MNRTRRAFLQLGAGAAVNGAVAPEGLDLPDPLVAEAYRWAAVRNVLAAVNPKVFPGYFSVCADGRGFGYGNTYPSLDGHQMTDALLWLGAVEVAKQNWDYVRGFQREDGALPIAILPTQAAKPIGPKGYTAEVSANGGLYRHWAPGNPLEALAGPTFIQNADAIFRRTYDRDWLAAQMGAVNLAADFLAALVDRKGVVHGSGYYVERPTRYDADGVTQPHAIDAFLRAAALNLIVGAGRAAARYTSLAGRIRRAFVETFWVRDHFAEYLHPKRGLVDSHGLSDSNWAALAFGAALPEQEKLVWPLLENEPKFWFGGMPTGIATEPEGYEAWEFLYPDRMDLAAMGRVWHLECAARARMGDADGLLRAVRRVCETGRANGYYWRERYNEKGGYGAEKYCEYPANLIRIVQRFVLGVELRTDGTLALGPAATEEYWTQGFGQTLEWRDRVLEYRFEAGRLSGRYRGPSPLALNVRRAPGAAWKSATLHPGKRFSIGL